MKNGEYIFDLDMEAFKEEIKKIVNTSDFIDLTNSLDQKKKQLQEDLKKQIEDAFNDAAKALATGKNREPDPEFKGVLEDIESYFSGEEATSEELINRVSIVLTIVTNIGMVVAILMSAILGVKYMLGSVEEKAEYKKDFIPYIVGAILLFGILTIVKILQAIGNTLNKI